MNAERSIEDGGCYGFECDCRKRRAVNLKVVIEQRVDGTVHCADALNRDDIEFGMRPISYKDLPVLHPPLLEEVSLNIGVETSLATLHRYGS